MTLKEFLAKKGLTQIEFAKLAAMPQSRVSLYVTGDAIPRAQKIKLIERLTSGLVRFDDWFTQSDEPPGSL